MRNAMIARDLILVSAHALAREGADVVLSYLQAEQRDARETASWVIEAGREALLVPGDVRQKRYCQGWVSKAMRKFGRLDIVVNNAAFQRTYAKPADITESEFDQTFRTNVYGHFSCPRRHWKRWGKADRSSIPAIQAFDPSAHLLVYAATKAALVNLTKGMAKASAKQSIRVNGVAPGPVWTPLIPSTMPRSKYRTFGSDTAFEGAAQSAEIAPLYVFLASQEASYVTGEIFGATGGQNPILISASAFVE
jgi:NAD(P)-dependent dehydrogenase (short-subunit alcohol dehydrogenase family)